MGKIAFMLQSLEEQGKPPLSRLVGRGRQVRIEPPCDGMISDGTVGLGSAQVSQQVPSSSYAFSMEVSSDDRPPGLSRQNTPSEPLLQLLYPVAPDAHPRSLLSPISLAVDLRSQIYSVSVRDMATQTNEVVG
ncbi:hypothetical protein COOONC_12163 [Cooperia oncophora]